LKNRPVDALGGVYPVPYPQSVRRTPGRTTITASAAVELPTRPDARERLAAEMVRKRLEGVATGASAAVRIASFPSVASKGTLLDEGARRFLETAGDEAYVLRVGRGGVVVVGKTSLGTLYGVQTLLQLLERRDDHFSVQNLEVQDFPAVRDRYIAIAMSWYAGYGRVGFGSQLWGREQWFWFIDWCLEHRVNGVNICMYGYYPFRFEEYPETVFKDVETTTWLSEAGREAKVLYTHPNVADEFLPELIRYANDRGITVLCYLGLNTFNGGYALAHPESRYQSDDPSKYHQFMYNLCPSRPDVRRFFDATVRRLLEIGFNGILLEESEGSGFCECGPCRRAYYGKSGDSRSALHRADYELFNRLYSVAREKKPDAVVGIRAWRMGSETGVDDLRVGRKHVPEDTLVYWSNAMDPDKFDGWVEVFGPERIVGQDAECLGFSTLYDGLVYMFPRQYASYLKFVDPGYKPQYPQSLEMDVRQYLLAAKYHCRGVLGYAFNWNGWELAPLSLAQYGWNPEAFSLPDFVRYGYLHQFGRAGEAIAEAVWGLPLVLETRICEGSASVPRDDPVSGGLAGLTSLQVPTRFGEGRGEEKALAADLAKANKSLLLLQGVDGRGMKEQDRITLDYLRHAAERTNYICKAALEYRKALAAERSGASKATVRSHFQAALDWALEDYRVVKESSFDLHEEFHSRILTVIDTISGKVSSCEMGPRTSLHRRPKR
jgi:hypothetical protein